MWCAPSLHQHPVRATNQRPPSTVHEIYELPRNAPHINKLGAEHHCSRMIATTCPSRPANVPIAISIPRPSNYWTRGLFQNSFRPACATARKVAAAALTARFRKRIARVIIAREFVSYVISLEIERRREKRSIRDSCLEERRSKSRSSRNRFRLAWWLEEVELSKSNLHVYISQTN